MDGVQERMHLVDCEHGDKVSGKNVKHCDACNIINPVFRLFLYRFYAFSFVCFFFIGVFSLRSYYVSVIGLMVVVPAH